MGDRGSRHHLSVGQILRSSTSWRIKRLKLLDHVLGRFLARAIPSSPATPVPVSRQAIRRILVIRPGGIGDAVLALPLLRMLRTQFSNPTIEVLAERRNADIFLAGAPLATSVYCHDHFSWSVWQELRRRSYDLIIDMEQWHQLSAVMAWTLGSAIRVGFDTNPDRSRCLTVRVPYRHDEFEGDSFLRLLSVLTGEPIVVDWTQPFLEPRAEERMWAERVLGGRKPIAVALRGGVRERCWEADKFRAFLPRLFELGFDVCWLGTSQDTAVASDVRRGLPADHLIDLIGKTSLLQSLAVLQQSRLFIGTDSGLMHMAYAVGTPTVTLFGSGIQEKWAPRGRRHRVLNHHLPCSPCTTFGYTVRCPFKVRCLREIAVEEVLQASREVLGIDREAEERRN